MAVTITGNANFVPMKNFKEELSFILQKVESDDFKKEILETKRLLSSKPLILYGAGVVGASADRVLKHYGIEALCFCDKNKKGTDESTGLRIISPKTLISEHPDANIIICSVNYAEEIKRDLEKLGVSENRIFSRNFLNLHEMILSDIQPHFSGYERVYDLYADDQSRHILLMRIMGYLTSSPLTSSPLTSQYFDSEFISLSEKEIFVDAGMYIGDTADQFFRYVNNKYKAYYGFEPDSDNYNKANISLLEQPNVTTINKGLWNCDTQLYFSGNLSSSSKIENVSTGNRYGNSVNVTALDIYFKDKALPTFIKMDIEGAELEALKGAQSIIRRYKPKLAICAYHKPEDVYTIPELINSYRNDYVFYLRHYTNSIYETVFYAI